MSTDTFNEIHATSESTFNPRQHRISIPHVAITILLDSEAQLGVSYGSDSEQVIAEDVFAGSEFQVRLQIDKPGWTMIVCATPPLPAQIALSLCDTSKQYQHLDTQGKVIFTGQSVDDLRRNFDLTVVLGAATE